MPRNRTIGAIRTPSADQGDGPRLQPSLKRRLLRRVLRSMATTMLAKGILHFVLPILGLLVVTATGFAAVRHFSHSEPRPPAGPDPAVVLTSLVGISEYHTERATYTANFVMRNHSGTILRFLIGHDLKVHAVGTVDVIEDFGSLTASAIKLSKVTATVTMPVPQLGQPVLNLAKSAVTRSDGIGTSLGRAFSGSDDQKRAYQRADRLIYSQAEAQSPQLITNAEANIQSFVSTLLMKVGVLHVTVNFR